ncbi:MAG: hypothetical protein ACI9P3_000700, partial [Bradyrhizobium sp.]
YIGASPYCRRANPLSRDHPIAQLNIATASGTRGRA